MADDESPRAEVGAELEAIARNAMSRLSPDHREVLRLAQQEHLTLVEHAPPECREPMLANVRLHRAIVTACRERGRDA